MTTGGGGNDVAERFDALQARLLPLWQSIGKMNADEQTIVVVPSITLGDTGVDGATMQALEERFLFLLFLLRQPRARLVYVTSRPIAPEIVDYYLDLLPGVIPSHARRRLVLIAAHDGSARPLTDKLLERPRLLARIRDAVTDLERAHLVPYTTTERERDLALSLGIAMYGSDPRFFPFGTKTGCRRLFAEEKVPHPLGYEDLRTVGEVVDAICRMRAERPTLRTVLVKHDEGASGSGNATSVSATCPRRATPARPRRSPPACGRSSRRPGASIPPRSCCGWARTRGSWRSASTAKRSAARACRCASPRSATWSCSRPTTSCWAGRRGRPISAAPSPPTQPTRRPSPPRRPRSACASLARASSVAVDFLAVRNGGGPWDASPSR